MPEDGYHLTEDLVDHAVDWVQTQQSLTPDKPFFTYLALGATHAPFHVAAGLARQVRRPLRRGLGRPARGDPGPAEGARHRAGGHRSWARGPTACRTGTSWTRPPRRVATRFMETYAGFAEHADHHVGRFVDALEELGVLEDTLFVYMLGDNGASGEGGPEGTLREHLVGHGFADDIDAMDAVRDSFGDPTTYPIYPVGWALAMNTPYQWTKQVASHYGGTRDGLVVHWPGGHRRAGGGTATSGTTSSTSCRPCWTRPGCHRRRTSTG